MKQSPTLKKQENLPIFLFHQGTNYRAYEFLGAHFGKKNGKNGVYFRTWAPNAKTVSVVGDFNFWDNNANKLVKISEQGIWETFVENLKVYDSYKFAITNFNKTTLKADPYAFHSEFNNGNASKVYNLNNYVWQDSEFINNRQSPYDKPMNIYEVNFSSWKRHDDGRYFTYRELANELISYVVKMGYTHIEIMPICEFPFDGSWGYQVTGYYSITSRFGTPEDFKFFVDCCHKNKISVILDWVPAHFSKDEFGLYEFDGTCCYESGEFGRKEHKEWGTCMFDWGRNEVQSFLISNAIFLLDEYHIDGLRVDAVASMLYLDYNRKQGEWAPNENGGNYNLQAIAFLKKLNEVVFSYFPNVLMIAEESTAFPLITKPTDIGGLGFNFKWNMGWMNDVLSYMQSDPYFRCGIHNKMTFSFMYAFSENFILPISHDEVVHGKKSLLDKMPGDILDKFAQDRTFLAYMYAHPGKKLTFMGNEFGQFKEWNYQEGLEFFMLKFDLHNKLSIFSKDLNYIYKGYTPFYQIDDSWNGFNWISADEKENNILSFERKDKNGRIIAVIVNYSGNVFKSYRLGLNKGKYKVILNTDDKKYGGNGLMTKKTYNTTKKIAHNREYSINIKLNKFTAIYFERIDD